MSGNDNLSAPLSVGPQSRLTSACGKLVVAAIVWLGAAAYLFAVSNGKFDASAALAAVVILTLPTAALVFFLLRVVRISRLPQHRGVTVRFGQVFMPGFITVLVISTVVGISVAVMVGGLGARELTDFAIAFAAGVLVTGVLGAALAGLISMVLVVVLRIALR